MGNLIELARRKQQAKYRTTVLECQRRELRKSIRQAVRDVGQLRQRLSRVEARLADVQKQVDNYTE